MYDRSDGDSLVVYETSPSQPLSAGVVAAVAAATDLDPTDDELAPLATVIDPDALDALFDPVGGDASRADGRVSFRYHDHEVTVDDTGRVVVARSVPSTGDD